MTFPLVVGGKKGCDAGQKIVVAIGVGPEDHIAIVVGLQIRDFAQQNDGVVAGGDLLSPSDAEEWLGSELKTAVLAFQDAYSGGAALVFWMPNGQRRLHVDLATDAVRWRCAPPHSDDQIEFGRLLWGEAREYPQEIVLAQGIKPAGLFHLRIT